MTFSLAQRRKMSRAVAFAAYWRQCEVLKDGEGKGFQHWCNIKIARRNWRQHGRLLVRHALTA